MKKKELKKKEERATIYFTLALILSMFAGDIAEWFDLSIFQYGLLVISFIFLSVGTFTIYENEKLAKESKNCCS